MTTAPETIEIFYTLTDEVEASLWPEYQAQLSHSELERLHRFRFQWLKHQHLLTRALARTTLATVLDCAPTELDFEAGDHDKPIISSPERGRGLQFNLTHTRGLVACIVGGHRRVGIDVERVDRKTNFLQISKRNFSAEEQAGLVSLPAPDRADRFYAIWTLKESYLKAIGTGISVPLGAISFEPHHPVSCRFDDRLPDDPDRWAFRLVSPEPGYLLAWAVEIDRPEERGRVFGLKPQKVVPLRR